MYHDLLGHAGIEHTYRTLAQQVYWPNMKLDVKAFCFACIVCQQRKAVMYEAEGMEHTELHGALKHIHVDLAGPFKSSEGQRPEKKFVTFEAAVASAQPDGAQQTARRSGRTRQSPSAQAPMQEEPASPKSPRRQAKANPKSKPEAPTAQQHWILIIIDYFTKAAELVPVPTKAADTIARALYDHWLCRYGVPTYVTSDIGTEFMGEFTAMLERLGIIHITTAVRHPQANGVCERLVGTIKRKLYSYCDGHPTHRISCPGSDMPTCRKSMDLPGTLHLKWSMASRRSIPCLSNSA